MAKNGKKLRKKFLGRKGSKGKTDIYLIPIPASGIVSIVNSSQSLLALIAVLAVIRIVTENNVTSARNRFTLLLFRCRTCFVHFGYGALVPQEKELGSILFVAYLVKRLVL